MTANKIITLLRIFILVCVMGSCKNHDNRNDYLLVINDTTTNGYGYKDQQGKIIIPPGKYEYCFTDTFKTYAIVYKQDSGIIAIDRHEKFLYKVFNFDNGPDYPKEGYFRIIKNNKIGFADVLSGKIIIQPQFDCALPFEEGKAKVSNDCKVQTEGEHSFWTSDNWFYINKTGKKAD